MKKYKTTWKKALAFMMCLCISADGTTLLAQAQENDKQEDDPIIVVSMGDSYSSGEGIEPFYKQNEEMAVKCKEPDWLAHRSMLSWSSQLKVEGLDGPLSEYKEKDVHWYFVAASGATTEHFTNDQEKEFNRDGVKDKGYLKPQLEIFEHIEKDTVDYVTLTIGGNDVGFTSIITTAVFDTLSYTPYIDPYILTIKFKTVWYKFKHGVREDIKTAYKNIAEMAGSNVKIIVAGYPTLLDENGNGLLFTKDEALEINSNVRKFNQELKKIVEECHSEGMNIYFVSVEEAFAGHEAYTEEPYIHGVIFGAQAQDLKSKQVTSDYSIHPNATGAAKYAECVQEKIKEIEEEERKQKELEEANQNWSAVNPELFHDTVDKEVDKMVDQILNRFVERMDEWFSQWMKENCDGC